MSEAKSVEMSEAQIEEYRTSFLLMDKNHDGVVSAHEFQTAIKSLSPNLIKCDVQSIIDEFDKEDKGALNFNEFLEMMTSKSKIVINDVDEDIKEAFRIFDRDSDGFVGADEIKETFTCFGTQLSREEVVKIIESADNDKDGKLSFDEFSILVKNSDSFNKI